MTTDDGFMERRSSSLLRLERRRRAVAGCAFACSFSIRAMRWASALAGAGGAAFCSCSRRANSFVSTRRRSVTPVSRSCSNSRRVVVLTRPPSASARARSDIVRHLRVDVARRSFDAVGGRPDMPAAHRPGAAIGRAVVRPRHSWAVRVDDRAERIGVRVV